MKKTLFTIGFLIFGLLANAQKHWSYEGDGAPENWGKLEGGENCGKSKYQSPINIVSRKLLPDTSSKKLKFHYESAHVEDIVDNGHSLQFDFKKGSYITYGNKNYYLAQFHAHEESEHTIDGVRYPLELHFVHRSMDGEVLVIGVVVKDGEENSYFEKLQVFKALVNNAREDMDIVFNPEKMYPKHKTYYTYVGSLTTPPCSDNVTWIIFKNPVEMTEYEIEDIAKHLPKSNKRPVQPLNGRKVFIHR